MHARRQRAALLLPLLLAAAPAAVASPYNQSTCARVRSAWNTPPAAGVSSHPIVLVVGEGTCATHWVGEAVANAIQKYVFHWRETIFPRSKAKELYGTSEYNAHRSQYRAAFQAMMMMPPAKRGGHDFRMLDGIFAAADEPIPQFFPYLFRAYPNAKIILSTRNSTDWVRSRSTNPFSSSR